MQRIRKAEEKSPAFPMPGDRRKGDGIYGHKAWNTALAESAANGGAVSLCAECRSQMAFMTAVHSQKNNLRGTIIMEATEKYLTVEELAGLLRRQESEFIVHVMPGGEAQDAETV